MILEGSNLGSALNWVREDLDESLEHIRDSLEAFAEDTDDRAPLRAVQEELEKLNLTFNTMQQQGAMLLTDEMIAVGGHMLHGQNVNITESLNALTDAVIVLPSYLDRIQAGHEDLPILLLPSLNELRATYDENLLSEGTLFAPNLDIIIPEMSGSEADHVAESEFPAFARKVRAQYQAALLGWLKEQSKEKLVKPMQGVCTTLYQRLGRNDLRRLWWIADNTMQGLRDHAIDNDLPLRRLFARLDLTLKAMVEQGERGPARDAVTALSRSLLFCAAQAHPGSRGTDLLRERFRLEELIPDREALLRARGAVTGRDAGLFRSIGEAIREELASVKDNLDMELRTGRVDEDQREESRKCLRQLSDTLQMLNLPVPAKAVEDLLPALDTEDGKANLDLDSPLLGLAQRLIEVEAILTTHIQLLGEPVEDQATPAEGEIALPPQEQRQILNLMLDECVNSLHKVQDAVHKRLEGDAEADYLTPLNHIGGALGVASQGEVSQLTDKLAHSLNAALAGAESREQVENLDALTDAVAALELYLAGCRDEQSNSIRFLEIMHQRLDGLPEALPDGEERPATEVSLPKAVSQAAKKSAPRPDAAATVASTDAGASDSAIDPSMLAIFLEEFDSVREMLNQRLADWLKDSDDMKATADIRRGFHTLKGSGRMVGATEMGDFAWRIEQMINHLVEEKISFSPALAETVSHAVAVLPHLKQRLVGEPSELDDAAIKALSEMARQLASGATPDVSELQALMPSSSPDAEAEAEVETEARPDAEVSDESRPETPSVDQTLQQLMITEIGTHLAPLDRLLNGLRSGQPQKADKDLLRSVHTLAGNFGMAPLGAEHALARALESYLENRIKERGRITTLVTSALEHCMHRFHQRLYVLQTGNTIGYPAEDDALLQELGQLAAREDAAGLDTMRHVAAAPAPELAAEAPPAPEQPAHEQPEKETSASAVEPGSILAIFLEEAVEVLERCDTLLNSWRNKLADNKLVQNLQREIHTFKGGARMAGLEDLGNLSHAMETLLENIASNRMEPTVAAVQALEEGCDKLNIWVEQLSEGQQPDVGKALQRFESRVAELHAPAVEDVPAMPEESDETGETAVDTSADSQAPDSGTEVATPATPRRRKRRAPPMRAPRLSETPGRSFRDIEDRPSDGSESGSGPQIRVAAELMDKLVNFAGEISIYRSRLEQQMGTVRYNLKEVDVTVQRLKEQLRKMDMESEAQMMSRYQKASGKTASEFDPLELDRFSNMQQLSRSLNESVSDLLSLHEMLDDSVRQAESLLTQQSRVSSELQEGLMQTRMTPFGSAAPRLRRVVRTAAAETGKKARLQLRMAGSNDQLDRNVLERITAPLEHMLRNAVAHGIEEPKLRKKRKKPEEGLISVTVEAEATEFVIRVQDDGGGINLDAVRRKAIERGLMQADEKVDPQRLVQFIRDSGFSTAETVTGLAGRGVGMDVVNSEIKQIGGSMEIETEEAVGSRFTVRIPFSLAVMQAIAVSVGDRLFQIPLNSVAGVARISPSEYQALAASESPAYEFAGEQFPLFDLEPLLDAPPLPLDSDNVSLLMIRAGDRTAAFRVSGMQGHQEVVIKPVGPQISSIPGILGGTIAGDGQVMLILDMGPMIRRGLERALEPTEPVAEVKEETRQPLIMVVDDSITMRKVTSRVLDNHSIEVMTAQDGVDAIEQLHDRIPDLMLLDIEMPRMDGYELLEHVRADARLRHVPVIMITSRAGQKHRKKARAAGADDYLTKPYQETELVEKVSEVLELDLVPRRTD